MHLRVPIVSLCVKNRSSSHEAAGSIPGLVQSVKGSGIAVSCCVAAARIQHRLAPAAPIRPLAWELPYAARVALKKQKFISIH